jgi:hypothetical protein
VHFGKDRTDGALDIGKLGVERPVGANDDRPKGAAPHVFVRPLASAQGEFGDDGGRKPESCRVTMASPGRRLNAPVVPSKQAKKQRALVGFAARALDLPPPSSVRGNAGQRRSGTRLLPFCGACRVRVWPLVVSPERREPWLVRSDPGLPIRPPDWSVCHQRRNGGRKRSLLPFDGAVEGHHAEPWPGIAVPRCPPRPGPDHRPTNGGHCGGHPQCAPLACCGR